MKWIRRAIYAVVLLVVIVLIGVYLALNGIIRTEVQKQSQASLGVPTSLQSADLSITGGSLALTDFEVNSPPNFTAPKIFTLGGVKVVISYGQLRDNPIHIKQITITNPVLAVEQSNMKLNLQALMDQMPTTSSGQPAQPTPGGSAPSETKKLIIDDLEVSNATVSFIPGLPGLSNKQDINVPLMSLKNVGNADGAQNGVAMKEVMMQVMTGLAATAGQSSQLPPAVRTALSLGLGGLSHSLQGNFGQQFGGAISGLGQNFQGQLQNTLQGGVSQGLGGLLNGKKSKIPASMPSFLGQ